MRETFSGFKKLLEGRKQIFTDLFLVFSTAVLLEAPDTVLIERVMGKRIDPETGG